VSQFQPLFDLRGQQMTFCHCRLIATKALQLQLLPTILYQLKCIITDAPVGKAREFVHLHPLPIHQKRHRGQRVSMLSMAQ